MPPLLIFSQGRICRGRGGLFICRAWHILQERESLLHGSCLDGQLIAITSASYGLYAPLGDVERPVGPGTTWS